MLIECPSGLSFNARKWKVKDRQLLVSDQLIKAGLVLLRMLEAVDEGVVAPGPYPFEPGKPVQWSKVAISDIMSALTHIRAGIAPEYDYSAPCEYCRSKMPLSVDLREIEHLTLSSEAKNHLATNEPLSLQVLTEDGVCRVKVKILKGEDFSVIAKYQRLGPAEAIEAQFMLHIVEITTPSGSVLKNLNEIKAFCREQEWSFQQEVEAFCDQNEGGVKLIIDASCPSCSTDQECRIPFGINFYFPNSTRD